MKRSSRRLEGKMSVHIKIGLDGKVVTARISAPESLAQAVGTCVTDSFNGLAIPAASGAGGEADLSIAFVPN
jgi:hypothetical protein